jgi:hypothetical protein
MRRLLRFFLGGLFFLAFSTVTPAQKFIAHVSTPESHRGRGWDEPYGGWNQSWGGSRHHSGSHYSYATEPEIGYAHGDSDWVPSMYMDYDQALTLGKEQLNQQAQPQVDPPLGDVARKFRESANQATPGRKQLSASEDNNRQ